jgi:hypothetical protein
MARISEHSLGVINQAVLDEFREASRHYPRFVNAHEGYAVLLEEVDELWDAIKLKQSNPEREDRILREACQVAAMAIRLLHDVAYDGGIE